MQENFATSVAAVVPTASHLATFKGADAAPPPPTGEVVAGPLVRPGALMMAGAVAFGAVRDGAVVTGAVVVGRFGGVTAGPCRATPVGGPVDAVFVGAVVVVPGQVRLHLARHVLTPLQSCSRGKQTCVQQRGRTAPHRQQRDMPEPLYNHTSLAAASLGAARAATSWVTAAPFRLLRNHPLAEVSVCVQRHQSPACLCHSRCT